MSLRSVLSGFTFFGSDYSPSTGQDAGFAQLLGMTLFPLHEGHS